MKLKRFINIFLLCSILTTITFRPTQAVEINEVTTNDIKVDARSAIAIDGETGEVLFEQNGYELVPMASTTKILTAYIAIEREDLDTIFTVTNNATEVRGSKVGYSKGEKVTVRELLYGLMYRSGNDAAITIAENISGSIEGFSDLMNHYAKSLGIIDSHFESPHGLDSQNHYSTAYDLAMLTKTCMKNKVFREIVGTKEISKDKYGFTRDYSNINKILYKIPNANGVKTGYTGQAGKCLVSSVNKNGRDIIIVVLNCYDRWNVTESIYNHIIETVAFQMNESQYC